MIRTSRNISLLVVTISLALLIGRFVDTNLNAQTPSPSAEPTVSPAPTALPTPEFPILSRQVLSEFTLSDAAKKLSGRIAFTATIGGYDRILVLDLDGKVLRILIDGPGNNSYPSWSSDGNQVAFVSDRDGNKEIYVADWEGNDQKRLTANNQEDDNPSFSPDNSRIVYFSQRGMRGTELFSMNTDGTNKVQISQFGSGKNSMPRWSPSGKSILFTTNRFWPGWDICLFDLESQKDSCILAGDQSYCRGSWSHSGNHFAFSYGLLEDIDIGIYSFKEANSDRLTKLSGKEYDPEWSPNDRYIVFSSESETGQGIFNLHFADVSNAADNVMLTAPYSMRYPSWSGVRTLELEARRIQKEEKDKASEKKAAPAESATATNSQ